MKITKEQREALEYRASPGVWPEGSQPPFWVYDYRLLLAALAGCEGERDELLKQLACLESEMEAGKAREARLREKYMELYDDAVIAHRFMETCLGEGTMGSDFSLKVPMMERWLKDSGFEEISRLRKVEKPEELKAEEIKVGDWVRPIGHPEENRPLQVERIDEKNFETPAVYFGGGGFFWLCNLRKAEKP